MNVHRSPVRLTTRALTVGSLGAAVILGLSLALDVAGQADIATLMGNAGIVVLLLTPVAGLVTTWWELRATRPTHALLAVAVLGVLFLATVIALLPRV
ncbi:MAG: hypothetical protein ABI452_03215 [Candidatus Limnocylindrales bacterium]